MATSSVEEDYHLQYALQLASASTLPMVFKAVIELGVLEIIEKAGPAAMLSASQIASQLPTKTTQMPLLLYGLAPVAKYFIRKEDGGSLSPYFRVIHDKVPPERCCSTRRGSISESLWMSSMEYVKKDPRFGEVFGGFVRGFNPLFMKRILDIYDGFEGLTSLWCWWWRWFCP
uniref:O-methyltransferase dimerisation domain-containing protein n=1 Tax=Salix viminalis TaxID=40686 RepID=A0A6N2ND74_SALVM